MKVRMGFVSNSSSSSFVLMGFHPRTSLSDNTMRDLIGRNLLWIREDVEGDTKYIVGRGLCSDYCGMKTFTERCDMNRVDILQVAFDMDVPESDIFVSMFVDEDWNEFHEMDNVDDMYRSTGGREEEEEGETWGEEEHIWSSQG